MVLLTICGKLNFLVVVLDGQQLMKTMNHCLIFHMMANRLRLAQKMKGIQMFTVFLLKVESLNDWLILLEVILFKAGLFCWNTTLYWKKITFNQNFIIISNFDWRKFSKTFSGYEGFLRRSFLLCQLCGDISELRLM